MNRIILYVTACLIVLSSCGDFLEERSQELAYASSCADLSELLVGNGYMNDINWGLTAADQVYFPFIHVMDDDVVQYQYGGEMTGNFTRWQGFYRWEQSPFNDKGIPYKDETWSKLYEHIGVTNTVIALADDYENDSEELRRKVKGEAQFLRAMYYFYLVNFYAKPYEESQKHEPGVPLKTVEYIVDIYYHRTSIDSVYQLITSDLVAAVRNLRGVEQKTVYRTNEFAARLLLSRVYLYMGRWQEALEQCDTIIASNKYHLCDLQENEDDATFSFLSLESTETMFTSGNQVVKEFVMKRPDKDVSRVSAFEVSPGLLDEYTSDNDLRFKMFFETILTRHRTIMRKTIDRGLKVSDFCLFRYAEVLLNKAEAMAMLDKPVNEVIDVLQSLRAKRFADGEPDEIDVAAGKDLVNFVRSERRRELCFEGHRWFDLRRYAVSPKYPDAKSLTHLSYTVQGADQDGVIEGYYRLEAYPKSKNWVLPIPEYAITFNQGAMIDNERDENELIKNEL